jgi:flavin reductase (DIM6/NTAB) family NADH-FMN oxidoreductase RutF
MATTLLSELLALFPCGVTVVTTRDPAAGDYGMTVGAFVPVSLAPRWSWSASTAAPGCTT